MEDQLLIEKAFAAQAYSYSPYSDFCVGAALLTKGGKVYTGCNIENSAYGPTNCAERTAIFKAVSEGEREFDTIAIVGNLRNSRSRDYCVPCGVCRQVMAEFCRPDFRILAVRATADYKTYTLDQLLPWSFQLSGEKPTV